jgi:acetyl-CoA carboxylase biotin carboxylase subunit
MECRIYAEDPLSNFMPSPGLIKALTNPGGPGIRNDSGVYSGFTIPMEYDPMISKLVVHGENRTQVLARMLRALEEYHLLGIRTNIAYLRKIIMHPEFISGDYDTHFIPNHKDELLDPEAGAGNEESIALAVAALLSFMKSKETAKIQANDRPAESAWKRSARGQNYGGRF